jgi:hypothetical protein
MLAACRVLTCVLAIVAVGEVSGVARADRAGSSVSCCGAQASARLCRCPAGRSARVRSTGGIALPQTCLGAGHRCDRGRAGSRTRQGREDDD